MSKQGCVVVISGPSGVGKGTLLKRYLDEHKNCYISISATTREPRKGEQNGVSYHFITRAEFMQLIDTGEILEHNKYGENFYGTLKKPIEAAVASGKLAILEIDVNGFMQIRDKLPNILSIFIAPPSVAVLKERLLRRGTEAQAQIDSRIKIWLYAD